MPRTRLINLFWLFLAFAPAIHAEPPLQPDPVKTPGDVLTRDVNAICTPGYSKTVRDVPEALKQQVYRRYGITARAPGEYEIDHLISLELGGSNSIDNLWPQSYETRMLNAHVKDRLENRLHALICAGQLSIEQAQRAIASDWVAAYRNYVGPLPALTEEVPTADAIASFPRSAHPPAQPDSEGNCPTGAPIKVSKRGIYHVPGSANYDRTKAKACFRTPEAAEVSGFRPPRA